MKAVPNCTLTFVYTERGNSTKERWYSCGNCTTSCIPQDQHVGDIMDCTDLKPVVDWDMNFPQEISALKNKYAGVLVWIVFKYCQTSRDVSVFTSKFNHYI
jgi:hypothetical protein